MKRYFIILLAIFVPHYIFAQVVITEVMYDPQGADTGREWIEVQNQGSDSIPFTTWKLFEENTNHRLSSTTQVGTIDPQGFAIIVTDRAKFLTDYPGVTVPIFDASFSLKNTGESIAIKNPDGAVVDQYLYDVSLGASDDGNSLQRLGSVWAAAAPTPGSQTTTPSASDSGNSSGSTPTATSTPQTSGDTSSASGSTSTTTTTSSDTSTPISQSQGPSNTTQYASSPSLAQAPQIYATIIGPKVVIAGVETSFEGRAYTRQKKLVGDAIYGWNFGDGSVTKGMKVTHRYKYPGKYYISLDASSQDTTTVEYMTIEVISPKITVLPKLDQDGLPYMIVHNSSSYDLDISNWILEQNGVLGTHFVIPKNTHILPNADIIFPSETTGLTATSTVAAILFPNSVVAYQTSTTNSSFATQNPEVVTEPPRVSMETTYVPKVKTTSLVPVVDAASTQDEITSTSSLVENQSASTASALPPSSDRALWFWAMGILSLVGVIGILLVRSTPPQKLDSSDEYEIVEER